MAEHTDTTSTLSYDTKAEIRAAYPDRYANGRRIAERHATTPSHIDPGRMILSAPDYAERMAALELDPHAVGDPSPSRAAYWLGYAEAQAPLYVHTLDGEPCEGPAVPDDALCAEHGRLYRPVR